MFLHTAYLELEAACFEVGVDEPGLRSRTTPGPEVGRHRSTLVLNLDQAGGSQYGGVFTPDGKCLGSFGFDMYHDGCNHVSHFDETMLMFKSPELPFEAVFSETDKEVSHKLLTTYADPGDAFLEGVSVVLERAGVIHREKRGRTHYCTLRPDRLDDAQRFVERTREAWSGRLDRLARFLEDDIG